MRFSSYLAVVGFAGLAWSAPKNPSKPSEIKIKKPLQDLVDVKLEALSGSEVKVSVKNLGKKTLNLFERGTLLDTNPVHKLDLASPDAGVAPFIGLHPRVRINGKLDSKSFRPVKGGETILMTIDAAEGYDLSAGGQFEISAAGVLPFSNGKNKIDGEASFRSNIVTLEVNGTVAAEVMARSLSKRSILSADCSAGRLDATRNSLAVCANLAYVAGLQALQGNNDQFFRYFRTTDPGMRATVSRRFMAVADECASRSNKASTFCTDQRRLCRTDYISYTLGTEITNCDLYFQFPLISRDCHGFGQATTTIHEMTHIEGMMNPATDDFPGHYGWPALTTLSPEQAIMNGDNYGFYANSVYTSNVNC